MRKIFVTVIFLHVLIYNTAFSQQAGFWYGLDAAKDRIDTYRKGNLTVVVRDRNGKPIPEARVSFDMQRHSFPFGSCISVMRAFDVNGPKQDSEQYLKIFAGNFNAAVAENSMKWGGFVNADGTSNVARRTQVRQCMTWLNDNNIKLRGHNVVWPSWEMSPKYLKNFSSEQLRDELYHHIDDAILSYRGELTDWDLVNEPVHHRSFPDIFGEEEVVYWYKRAHELDPGTPLYVNQYDVLNGTYFEEYKRWIALLKDGGAPLGGIGVQGHVKTEQFIGDDNLEKIWNMMNELAAFGLPIKITEFDCEATNGEDRQAQCLENALILCFSHPAVEGFMLWGFWDGSHWRNTERFGLDKAGLWREDWTEKPSAKTWRRLIYNEWWTSEKKTTNPDGRTDIRGFKGDYLITVSVAGKERMVPASISGDDTVLTVTMP